MTTKLIEHMWRAAKAEQDRLAGSNIAIADDCPVTVTFTFKAIKEAHEVAPSQGLLPIFADGGLGSRLLHAAEAYAKDEYIFSPDEGSDHEPTEFERMLFEDMLNGLFAHEVFADILQEAARAAISQDKRHD